MDYFVTMSFKFPDNEFYIKDIYDILEWFETTIPKPTDEELQQYWQEIQFEYFKGIILKQKNMLLISSDFRALPDCPHRDIWLSYRQELRDLPAIWTIDTQFPIPPE